MFATSLSNNKDFFSSAASSGWALHTPNTTGGQTPRHGRRRTRAAIMSAPTAGSITSLRRTPIPDIRPICALADAAEAVSRVAVANNGGIAPTNDNDNAAILASLSSASLLPNRGGNVVSPTSQLQLENPTSSFDSNSNTKRYKKKLCVIPMCTNGSVKGGVCVAHGARRHMNICHFKGCKKSMKVGDFCHTHVRRCDAPGCLRFVAHGVRTIISCAFHSVL